MFIIIQTHDIQHISLTSSLSCHELSDISTPFKREVNFMEHETHYAAEPAAPSCRLVARRGVTVYFLTDPPPRVS